MAMLGTCDVLTFVASLIWPCLNSITVLLVIFPVTIVNGSVLVNVFTFSVGLIIAPLSLINIAIGVDEPANAIGFATFPLALIERSIKPGLASNASPTDQVFLPLTVIDGTTAQTKRTLIDVVATNERRLESSALFVDFGNPLILEEVLLLDSVIKFAYICFIDIADHFSNFFHAFTNELATPDRLNLADSGN